MRGYRDDGCGDEAPFGVRIWAVLTDLVIEPFGADALSIVEAAESFDVGDSGFDGWWAYDHFTAMFASNRSWSRDPFALLGAIAVRTDRLRIGTLVANIFNRSTVQLASAVNTLQSLSASRLDEQRLRQPARARERVVCGIGSGAAPASRFAIEHEAIGTSLKSAPQRRSALVDTVAELREIWAENRCGDATDIVDGSPIPPIIVGASGRATVRVAIDHADGVNIRSGPHAADLVRLARRATRRDFEIGVITPIDLDHPLGGDVEAFARLGVDRRVLAVRAPFDREQLARIGHNIAARFAT